MATTPRTIQGVMPMTQTEIEIIKNMCEHNLSIQKVAQVMFFHRNTIVYHIERIKEKYGLNAKCYKDLKVLEQMVNNEMEAENNE